MRVLSSAFTLSTVFAATLAQTGPEIAAYFKTHLSKAADVYLPSESNYSLETTQRWNANRAPSYVVSVKPASNQDVQEIVCSQTTNRDSFAQHSSILVADFLEKDSLCLPKQDSVSGHRWWPRHFCYS